jgi:hypothetical protein
MLRGPRDVGNGLELLKRKRALLDDRQQARPDRLIAIDHELQEIDEYLTRLESTEVAPAAGAFSCSQITAGRS